MWDWGTFHLSKLLGGGEKSANDYIFLKNWSSPVENKEIFQRNTGLKHFKDELPIFNILTVDKKPTLPWWLQLLYHTLI